MTDDQTRLQLRREFWNALALLGTKLYVDLKHTGLTDDDCLGWVQTALRYEAERLDFGVPPAWARALEDTEKTA